MAVTYRVIGTLVYSSTANGNSIRSALNSAFGSHPSVSASAGGSGATVTIDATAPTEAAAVAFWDAITPSWSAQARSSGGCAITRVST